MQHAQRLTLEQMREFVASSGSLSFTCAERKEIYGLVERASPTGPQKFRPGSFGPGKVKRVKGSRGNFPGTTKPNVVAPVVR